MLPLPTIDFHGQQVSAIGFGAMGMSEFYGSDFKEVPDVLNKLIASGCDFWDTSDVYGDEANEKLLAPYLAANRSKIFIATKFGLAKDGSGGYGVRGDRAYVREACEASLKRLGVESSDLYYQHRVDPKVSIEETMMALKELQDEGKIKHIGISECSLETLKEASKIVKVAALQIEYSIFTPDIETNGILDACRELGTIVVAYSPVGRGFLSTTWKSSGEIPADDYRKTIPRWQGEAFQANLRFVEEIKKLAEKKSCTANQLALAWVMKQPGVLPIPGTKRVKYLEENLAAASIVLSDQDEKEIRDLMEKVKIVGGRYDAGMTATLGH